MARLHAFDFLQETTEPAPMAALFGGVALLKSLARKHLLDQWAEDADVTQFEGAKAATPWRDVRDEVATISMFGGGKRIVWVREADDFVSANRKELEKYASEPLSSGIMILELNSFPANTKLFKAVEKIGVVIDCKVPELARGRGKPVPDTQRIAKWLCHRAKQDYECELELTAAQAMIELIGLEFGLLDQELARLSLYAEPGEKLSAKDVRKHCGGWRSQTTWDMLDAALDGQCANAMEQLDQLLRAGEHPNALFGQISWSLRRYAAAARIFTIERKRGQRTSPLRRRKRRQRADRSRLQRQ